MKLSVFFKLTIAALLLGLQSIVASGQIPNGGFETGNFSGWTVGGINAGFVLLAEEGTCFSAFETKGITLNGKYAANVRSGDTAPTNSIGILTSSPFVASAGVSFVALSETSDHFPSANPVTLEVALLGTSPAVSPQVVVTNIVQLDSDLCITDTGERRDGIFSHHFIDTSAFIGQTIQIEFRQHTNNAGFGWFTLIDDVAVAAVTVPIDIKPDGFPNSINLGSNGKVPVAILSTSSFDATEVDPASVILASASVDVRSNGTVMAALQDVDGDGLLDLVLHMSTQALQLTQTDTQAVLSGMTFGGVLIRGTDSIRVIP